MAATSGSVATAVAVCSDMTEGIMDRFRTMAITPASVLTGHVIGSMLQTLVEAASNAPLPLQLLPFLGSAIVPTDSMPARVQACAENHPFTPIIETLRGLLMGTEIGAAAWRSIAWCLVLAAAGYVWARWAYRRTPRD